MALYHYKVQDKKGRVKEETVEAANKTNLARRLQGQGYFLLELKRVGKEGKDNGGNFIRRIITFDVSNIKDALFGVPLIEKMMFSRNLAVMLGAGVPIIRALNSLSKQTKSPKLKRIIQDTSASIKKGEKLAQALQKYEKDFSSLYISMLRVGEAAGNLREVLKLLAEHLKKEHDLRSRVRGAMTYPAVIIVVMVGVGILMMIMVVPQLESTFADLEIELPFTTRLIFATGHFLAQYWWTLPIVLLGLIYGLKKLLATIFGKRSLDWLFLHAPLFRGLVKKISIARFTRTLSSLLRGGVSILESLEIVEDTMGNYYYKTSVASAREMVRKGEPVHKILASYRTLYPPLTLQMFQVGEETGRLDTILQDLANFYEEEVDAATKNLSSIIEPVLMVIIGAVVGFFAISMIQPMYSMMGQL